VLLFQSSPLASATSSWIFAQDWGACALWRDSQKNERETFIKGRGTHQAHEFLAASGTSRSYRKLFKVEGQEKLLGFGPPTPGVGCTARAARDRYFLTRAWSRHSGLAGAPILS